MTTLVCGADVDRDHVVVGLHPDEPNVLGIRVKPGMVHLGE